MPVYLSDLDTDLEGGNMRKGTSLRPSEATGSQRHLNLYIDAELIQKAKIQALRRRVSVSSVVEGLLKKWVG